MQHPPKDSFGLPIVSPDGDAFLPEGAPAPVSRGGTSGAATGRPAIGVYFACSNRYVRVLRDVGGGEYLARCPVCSKTMSFLVGPGGSSQRMFRVTCK